MSELSRIDWKVAGRAGEGIDLTGVLFGKICMRHGMQVFTYREYPSLIRGGHNTHQIHASFSPVTCQQQHITVLVAFNQEGITQHLGEIDKTSVVICEPTQDRYDVAPYQQQTGATFYDVPMTTISREETGHFLATNMVALGASVWLFGLDVAILEQVIRDQFGSKNQLLVDNNLKAAKRGYAFAQEHCAQLAQFAPQTTPPEQMLLTGNHAVALGAVAGGVQFFSAYPMTPTSEILHTLASMQGKYPLLVKHVEDEIAAMNQAIGASYAGVRAMTASATGGFALMVEALALAAIAEVPLVVCVGQRPGPATGLPTWTCQSDLQFVLHAGHGEFPRVVLTPGTIQEHLELTRQAFQLAETYQLPVFILSDKYALESYASIPTPNAPYANERFSFAGDSMGAPLPSDDSYRRFPDAPEGFSPRSIPGQPHGLSITNSYEHDEFGYATEDGEMSRKMNKKRYRKLASVAKVTPGVQLIGPATAPVTLVSWGSTRLVLEEVVRQLNGAANLIHFPCVWPFPTASFEAAAKNAKRLICVEGNQTGQLMALIRQETGIVCQDFLRRFDGRPFDPQEITATLRQVVEKT